MNANTMYINLIDELINAQKSQWIINILHSFNEGRKEGTKDERKERKMRGREKGTIEKWEGIGGLHGADI